MLTNSQSFPSLRSIYSFVTAPFARQPLLPQTNQDLPIEDDQKSQSGSEDGWNGSPPAGMEDQDVFSVAAAGGRGGEDFDRRAIEYRSDAGNSRDTAKANASVGAQSDCASLLSELIPQTSVSVLPLHYSSSDRRSQPFTPSVDAGSSKRPLTSTFAEHPIRKPLPSFLPTAQTAAPPQSAASIAFTAFVEAKKGQNMTSEDMRVMRTLMENIEAEQRGVTSTTKTGGWSAGLGESPRPFKAIPNGASTGQSGPVTPNRLVESVRGTGGPLFSTGTPGGRSDAGSVGGESPASRRIRYLGPGMSPRRMFNKSRASDKPAFATDVAEESEPKRQKVDDAPNTPQNVDNQTPAFGSPMQIDTPAPTPPRIRALEKAKGTSTNTPARPSPLGQSPNSTLPASPREESSVAQGKRRAADIVKELMQEEIGPLESLNKRDYMVINPYDISTPGSASQQSDGASSSLSNSVMRSATPKKTILRSSLRSSTSTPLSGAAAKLEAHKPGRKLTTLELLEGKKPVSLQEKFDFEEAVADDQWTGPIVDETMRSQTPSPSRDAIEVDELMEESPAPTPAKKSTPPPASPGPPARETRPMPKMPEPFKAPAFSAPDVSSPARPIPTFVPSPSPSKPIPAGPSAAVKEADRPVFSFAPPKLAKPLPEIENSTLASFTRAPKSSTTPGKTVASRSPAQESALKLSAASLPTFTFTVSGPKSKVDESVRASALSGPIEHFTFDLSASTKPQSTKPTAKASGADWTCGLCMLKNPDSAKEKCTVCEAPRPAAGGASTKSSTSAFGSVQPPSAKAAEHASGPWTCSLCMLQNPDSAKDKCQICEAARP